MSEVTQQNQYCAVCNRVLNVPDESTGIALVGKNYSFGEKAMLRNKDTWKKTPNPYYMKILLCKADFNLMQRQREAYIALHDELPKPEVLLSITKVERESLGMPKARQVVEEKPAVSKSQFKFGYLKQEETEEEKYNRAMRKYGMMPEDDEA